MKKHLLYTLVIVSATMGCSISAYAQSIDYGALQELFGEPITTNATGTPQRASEVAANMTIITADQIRQSGSRAIPEIIGQYVPGVDILRSGNAGYDVGVRGDQQVFQPRLLVLVDGRQVFIDDYSRTIWNNIPVNIDDIRQIEVVKGPASALFGSNAASGVVNIITYSPIHDNNNVVTAGLGTQRKLLGDATVTQNGEWGGTKFSAGGLNEDEFHTGRSRNDSSLVYKPDRRYVTNSSVIKLTPDLSANGEFTYSESKQNIALNTLYSQVAEDTTTYSARGGLGWQTSYGLITSDTYFNHTYDTIEAASAIAPSTAPPSGLTTDLIVSNLTDQFKIGADHTFRMGLEYRHKEFRIGGLTIAPGAPSTAEDNYAAGGTWLWQVKDNLSWTNALRVDHQDMQQTGTLPTASLFTNSNYSHAINTWSANSALAYKLTDMDTIHATYGRGVQLPSQLQSGIDLLTLSGSTPVSYEGNPYLKPTITQNYELGYDRKVPDIFSTAKISAFYQLIQDDTNFVNRGFTSINGTSAVLIEALNLGNSRSYGGEIQLLGNHEGFRWDASYSLARVTDSPAVLAGQDFQGSSPEHHIRLNGGYTYQKWEFDANGQYVTSTNMLRDTTGLGGAATPTDGYMTVGGRIGYNVTDRVAVALSGSDLNRRYIGASPYPAVERQALLTLTGKF